MDHSLKVWPEFYRDLESGKKNFEVRRDDQDFAVGDMLILHEYNNVQQWYTGNSVHREIIYLLFGGRFGIEKGFCVLGLKEIEGVK